MDSGRWLDNGRVSWIVHKEQRVRKGACRVDDSLAKDETRLEEIKAQNYLGFDVPFFAC